jgi:hypothetical protein
MKAICINVIDVAHWMIELADSVLLTVGFDERSRLSLSIPGQVLRGSEFVIG